MPFPFTFPFTFDVSDQSFPSAGTLLTRIAFQSDPLEAWPIWNNITGVREVHIRRGRNHDLDRMEAGSMDIIIDNQNGNLWPDNAGGDYSPNVKTMKKINVRAIYNGTIYNLFTGYIESYNPGWLGDGGYGSIMTLHCVDGFKVLGLQVLNAAGYSAEQSGTRFANVLTSCSWPTADRAIDPGQDVFQATGALVNVNALEHLQQGQESELGLFYMDVDGKAVFEDRSHRTASPHSVSQATFGEAGGLPFTDLKYVLDETLLFNDVRITRTGGAEQIQSNSASQTAYGKRSLVRATLHSTDAQALRLAIYYLARYAAIAGRVESIQLLPSPTNSLWAQVMNRKISDRITVRKTEAGIDQDYFIEGITHDWVFTSGEVSTQYQLSDADLYMNTPDSQTVTLNPSANGALLEWDSGNYATVSDDSDATYLSEGNTGTLPIDVFVHPGTGYSIATVDYVKVTIRGNDTSGTPRNDLRAVLKIGANYYYGSWVLQADAIANFTETWNTSPATGVAWTIDEVNNMQFGVQAAVFHLMPAYHLTKVYKVSAETRFTPGW